MRTHAWRVGKLFNETDSVRARTRTQTWDLADPRASVLNDRNQKSCQAHRHCLTALGFYLVPYPYPEISNPVLPLCPLLWSEGLTHRLSLTAGCAHGLPVEEPGRQWESESRWFCSTPSCWPVSGSTRMLPSAPQLSLGLGAGSTSQWGSVTLTPSLTQGSIGSCSG